MVQDLSCVVEEVSKDLEFLQSGEYLLNSILGYLYFTNAEIVKFNNEYSEKLQSHSQKGKNLIVLAWKVKELTEPNETGRELYRKISLLASIVRKGVQTQENIPSQLTTIHTKLLAFIKGVTCHQRIPATHVLVFMTSSEDRRKKPYALSIQCIPYKGLSDAKIHH